MYQKLSQEEARKEALIELVKSARAGAKPEPNKPGEITFSLTPPELCRSIGGSFGNPESELMVRIWNEELAAFKAKEVVGCNYDIKPVAF